jgi:hypothetical protein
MGNVIASATTLAIGANSKSADQISGTYQFLPNDSIVYLYARGSATGVNIQFFADGVALCNDLPVSYFGATGALSQKDHEVASFPLSAGSRIELYYRNTTAGALTVDYQVVAEPLE